MCKFIGKKRWKGSENNWPPEKSSNIKIAACFAKTITCQNTYEETGWTDKLEEAAVVVWTIPLTLTPELQD